MTTGNGEPGAEDQGADGESGVFGTDTNDELLNGCLIEPIDGAFGYVHQCAGGAGIVFGHDTNVLVGDELIAFGYGGFEAPPKVMACCDIYDPGPPPPLQPHETACYKDMIETFCEESVAGLAGAEFTAAGIFEPEAIADLVSYLSAHAEDCNEAFQAVIDEWDILYPEGPLDDIFWQINETFEKNLFDTNPIVDPIITIDFAGIDMESLSIPGGDEYAECIDNDLNDGQFFPTTEESPGFMLFLDEGDGILTGPIYTEDPMIGNLEFASNDTSCSAPLCSQIQFTENISDWTLHNLSLYSSTNTMVSDGTLEVTANWFHIELAGPVRGQVRGTDFFQVPAGKAIFSLGGVIEGEAHHLVVSNASTILVQKVGDEWQTSSFALYYVDSEEDSWSLFVSGAQWVSPI